MQSKRKSSSRKLTLNNVLTYLGLMFIAYLPVSSFQFFLKNDAFGGYFPSKYYISESIRSYSFPWWNPYINFGIPQYGDMNSGFWSPITWIIAQFFHYNAYTFTAELLLYLFLAGLGMFRLCRILHFTRTTSYIIGASYLCSGYMVGHLQHFNWISAAAFLPWCLYGYHLLINRFSMKNVIQSALWFYLFISSAHPGLIIGGIYFFLGYAVFSFFEKRNNTEHHFNPGSFVKKHLWMLLPLFLFSLGLIAGYSDVIPYITRGSKLSGAGQIVNPFTLQSLISLAVPMATVKASGFFSTDVSMRNIYMGLTFLLFLLPALRMPMNKHQKFFLYTGLFFLLISIGGPFKYINYYLLPLGSYVRMPGEFMIFAIISFLLFTAFSMNSFIADNKEFGNAYHKSYFTIQIILVICIIAGIAGIAFSQHSIFFSMNRVLSPALITSKLKSITDNLSIFDILIIQGLLQLTLLQSIKKNIIKKDFKQLIKISFIELIFATLLNIPFTGVGQASVNDVQSALSKAPEGIPTPFLTPVSQHVNNTNDRKTMLLGSWSFYNKQIGSSTQNFYPVELNTTHQVFKDSISLFHDKPFIFTTNDSLVKSLRINYFKGNFVDLQIECTGADTLVLQENVYKHWMTVVNGEYRKPIQYAGVFNAVYLQPGKNFVKFNFNPKGVASCYEISRIAILIALLYLLVMLFKRSSPS